MEDEEHEGDHEQYPRDLRRHGRNAADAERAGNQSDDQKDQSVIEHQVLPADLKHESCPGFDTVGLDHDVGDNLAPVGSAVPTAWRTFLRAPRGFAVLPPS